MLENHLNERPVLVLLDYPKHIEESLSYIGSYLLLLIFYLNI